MFRFADEHRGTQQTFRVHDNRALSTHDMPNTKIITSEQFNLICLDFET